MAATGYLLGITQSREYAEPEWYVDLWLTIVWVAYLRRLPRHAPEAQGTAHLRRQLVLPRLHRHHRDAARRQQPGDAGLVPRLEELLGLLRRAGRADPVVVRPQRGRLLPDRRLPRHDVLLRAQAGEPAGLFLPAVDRPLLGADLPLHLGRPASPALHGAAGLGADARHGVLDHAVDAVLGRHDQRPDDAVGRLGQAPHRPDHPHDGDRRRLLRHVDLRRPGDVDQGGQLAQPLHRLDHRPRPFRRARLGRHDLVRRHLLPGAEALEPRAALLAAPGQLALLARDARHRPLRGGDVGVRHHAGPDVARVRRAGLPRLLLRRDGRGHASLLRDARARRPALPRRRAAHGLQHHHDHPRPPARGRTDRRRSADARTSACASKEPTPCR